MKIPENRIYSHPMFSKIYDHYKDNDFNVDFDTEYDYTTAKFLVKTDIKNKFILEMLKSEKFVLGLHIDCTKTKFRKMYNIPYEFINKDYEVVINSDDLIGEAEVTFLIVTIENIKILATSEFDDFYKGNVIEFPQFAIVGFSDTYEVSYNKRTGINQPTSSIFRIVRAQIEHKRYSLENDFIAILIPEKEHDEYIKLQGKAIRNKQAIFVEPALAYALYKISQDKDGVYSTKEWYKSLDMSCTKIGIDINSEDFKEIDVYELASKLLNNPDFDALKELNVALRED